MILRQWWFSSSKKKVEKVEPVATSSKIGFSCFLFLHFEIALHNNLFANIKDNVYIRGQNIINSKKK